MTPKQRKHIDELVNKYSDVIPHTYNGVSLTEYNDVELRAILTDFNIRAISQRQGPQAVAHMMKKK